MNRHLKIAFFMAPLLALGAYALTGYFMTPQQNGPASSALSALGKCKPLDNACIFQAGDLEIKLISNEQQQQQQLAVFSNKPVSALTMALGNDSGFEQFPMMKSDDGKYWQIKLKSDDNILKFNTLRMALRYKEQSLYVESEVYF